ncbi:glutaredoxin domain-containing protein [Lipingzhangella rawalii]|nr:glutaredoxin domain-containing protein [Lipingzhangella rawalii]
MTAAEPPSASPHGVLFYWRPGCPFCFALRRGLRRERIPLVEFNIWADAGAAARVRSITGGDETVPTVVVGPAELVSPPVNEVVRAVRAHAPELLTPSDSARSSVSPTEVRGWFARLRSMISGVTSR